MNHRPAPAKVRGFLYIRRFPGERIALFDQRMFGWIEVIDIDLDARTARLNLPAEDNVEISLFENRSFLQGDGFVRLHSIQETHDGQAYVSIGIKAPRTLLVRREELIQGMPPEDIQKIAS